MVTSASNETRERILVAAEDAVLALAAAGMRVDAVAQAAAVNKRMIYHYFNDKEGLIRAVYVRQAHRISVAVDAFQPGSRGILESFLAQWLQHNAEVPEATVSVDQLRQAIVILLPVMTLDATALDGRLVVSPVQWAGFALDVISLAFADIAQGIFGATPGDPEFRQLSEHLLSRNKPRYRMSSDSRPTS